MNLLKVSSCIYAVDSGVIQTALLNTVIGMGIVFVVLILISFLISLFKFIPSGKEKKVEVPVAASVEAPVEETEELVDDTELVAVITAAIMASMGDEAPADGLVVRSIRRTNRKKLA